MKKLKSYLKRNKLKYTPWSVRHKLSPSSVYRFLNNKGTSLENIKKISAASGISIYDLTR